MEKSECLAIATTGPGGPHLAACWARNILPLDAGAGEILIPAWRLETTEGNLRLDPRVKLLFVARVAKHVRGSGRGCTIVGTGELHTAGPRADANKARFPWARGVLIVKITGFKTHLS